MVIMIYLLLAAAMIVVVWLVARALEARDRIEELSRQLTHLDAELTRLKSKPSESQTPKEAREIPGAVESILERKRQTAHLAVPIPQAPPAATTAAAQETFPEPAAAPGEKAGAPVAPPIVVACEPEPAPPIEKAVSAIDWEQFMGVKLFAWIGGLALFLGVAFFVKYSFDKNLISPELRAAIGFLAGIGLIIGGVAMSRKKYPVLSGTLCATGVVILYAVTFACRSIYHFPFFGPGPAFLIMALITTAAFLLAVRLDALVVAILGMLGGFLTPVLLSTGQDNPPGLFGYIAILDAGLIVVALHRRWFFLTALAAAGTCFLQIGWADKFFVAEKYFDGDKILVALAVLLGFEALFLAAGGWAKRRAQMNWWLAGGTLGLAAVALAFSGWFLSFAPLAQRPWLMFSFVFLVDLGMTALVLLDNKTAPAQPIAGLAVFALLGCWTANSVTNELLNAALAFYFIFGVFHSILPLVLQRRFGIKAPLWAGQVFPALALVLVLVPLLRFAEISFLVWPFVLLVDVLAIGLAVVMASLISVLAVLILTLVALGAMIFKIPATLTGLPVSFFLLGAFAVFFVTACVWLARKFHAVALAGGATPGKEPPAADLTAQLPMLSAVLPFLLLIMATLKLPLANPSPVFGLALLFTVLLLGVAKLLSIEMLPAVGLICVSAVEWAWHRSRFDSAHAVVPLVWYLVFFAVFTIFPFVFLRQWAGKVGPWAAAAMAGVPQFFLVHRLVKAAWPNQVMGLVPLAFAIPPLAGLIIVLKRIPAGNPARLAQLAWFGGVALFFITLIFPIQFDRQWITIGWALEGAALLWLFHRVPHAGLRWTGAGLLIVAFVRLALNPAVIEYHRRSATPILNWYLYAYSVVTVCLFAGARLLAPPRNSISGVNAPPILAGLGTALAFLLVNIEIADFFSAPGSTLTFQFEGNFARDMSYSIAWALFALVLLVVGIARKIPALRYAALGLLSITLLKLFLHDLARLGQLYRIGAFLGVAIIAMLASFAYQRFFAATLKPKESKIETTR